MAETRVELTSDYPIPSSRGVTGEMVQVLSAMEVKQSFIVPDEWKERTRGRGKLGINNIRAKLTSAAKLADVKITTRQTPDGIRVWRIG